MQFFSKHVFQHILSIVETVCFIETNFCSLLVCILVCMLVKQVIQRRIDGEVDFNRTWEEYEDGFGDINHGYWIGKMIL